MGKQFARSAPRPRGETRLPKGQSLKALALVRDDSNFGEEVEAPLQKLELEPCVHCGKQVTRGYVGRWNVGYKEGGTCSVECEKAQEMKPRDYGEPSKKNLNNPTHF